MKQYQTVINEWFKLSGSQTRKGLHQQIITTTHFSAATFQLQQDLVPMEKEYFDKQDG